MAFKLEWHSAHVQVPFLHLAASRIGGILEDSSEEVMCKLILEEGWKETHPTEQRGKGMEGHL